MYRASTSVSHWVKRFVCFVNVILIIELIVNATKVLGVKHFCQLCASHPIHRVLTHIRCGHWMNIFFRCNYFICLIVPYANNILKQPAVCIILISRSSAFDALKISFVMVFEPKWKYYKEEIIRLYAVPYSQFFQLFTHTRKRWRNINGVVTINVNKALRGTFFLFIVDMFVR